MPVVPNTRTINNFGTILYKVFLQSIFLFFFFLAPPMDKSKSCLLLFMKQSNIYIKKIPHRLQYSPSISPVIYRKT